MLTQKPGPIAFAVSRGFEISIRHLVKHGFRLESLDKILKGIKITPETSPRINCYCLMRSVPVERLHDTSQKACCIASRAPGPLLKAFQAFSP